MGLSEVEIDRLDVAMRSLRAEQSCVPWGALTSLGEIGGTGMHLTIDMRASDKIGAAVIVAVPRLVGFLPKLSRRQNAVMQLLGEGNSNKEIARSLGIALSTVKDHVHAILERTGCRSRAELIANLAILAGR